MSFFRRRKASFRKEIRYERRSWKAPPTCRYAVCIKTSRFGVHEPGTGCSGDHYPCGSSLWCSVRCLATRLCLAALGLVLAPTLCGESAQGGYVTSGAIYWVAAAKPTDAVCLPGMVEQAEVLVVGIPLSTEVEWQDTADDYAPRPPCDRQCGTQVLPGSGRTPPADPPCRKRSSSPDLVIYTDRSAPWASRARPADLGDTVNLYTPCVERLFRPPRPATPPSRPCRGVARLQRTQPASTGSREPCESEWNSEDRPAI